MDIIRNCYSDICYYSYRLFRNKEKKKGKNPKITKFKAYLKEKLTTALRKNLSTGSKWVPGTQFGIGIYVKNTPGNLGSVKQWSTFCGGQNQTKSLCPVVNEEPNFFWFWYKTNNCCYDYKCYL